MIRFKLNILYKKLYVQADTKARYLELNTDCISTNLLLYLLSNNILQTSQYKESSVV